MQNARPAGPEFCTVRARRPRHLGKLRFRLATTQPNRKRLALWRSYPQQGHLRPALPILLPPHSARRYLDLDGERSRRTLLLDFRVHLSRPGATPALLRLLRLACARDEQAIWRPAALG
jgi:hypothetical protein